MKKDTHYVFNPAPGWPVPPEGWSPPKDWQPDASWPPAPRDWVFWVDPAQAVAESQNEEQMSEPANSDSSETISIADPTLPAPETRRERREAGKSPADGPKIGLFNARRVAKESLAENRRLLGLVDQYGLLDHAERVKALDVIKQEVTLTESKLADLLAKCQGREERLVQLDRSIVGAEESIELQDAGFYKYIHPAESSTELSTELADVRTRIKELQRNKSATRATSNFTYNNSAAKGRNFVSDLSKLMLRAYNAEAENAVKSVRAGNLAAAQKRLSGVVDSVARQGKMIDLCITSEYHRLRLSELELAARHLEAVKAERDEEKLRRAELREQRKAEAELRAAREKLMKERSHYENAIATLLSKGDEDGAAQLRVQMDLVNEKLIDVESREANIRAGHVYVISNKGAFGERMVKIGMTRRLEPMDRVRELGDASVPFRFDVHALFFAEDAVGIEAMLHQTFASQRVNQVNRRREFFYVTPGEVLDVLKQKNVHVIEFTSDFKAEEFTLSQEIRQTSQV